MAPLSPFISSHPTRAQDKGIFGEGYHGPGSLGASHSAPPLGASLPGHRHRTMTKACSPSRHQPLRLCPLLSHFYFFFHPSRPNVSQAPSKSQGSQSRLGALEFSGPVWGQPSGTCRDSNWLEKTGAILEGCLKEANCWSLNARPGLPMPALHFLCFSSFLPFSLPFPFPLHLFSLSAPDGTHIFSVMRLKKSKSVQAGSSCFRHCRSHQGTCFTPQPKIQASKAQFKNLKKLFYHCLMYI